MLTSFVVSRYYTNLFISFSTKKVSRLYECLLLMNNDFTLPQVLIKIKIKCKNLFVTLFETRGVFVL